MLTLFRFTQVKYQDSAFSGEGAKRSNAGRWHMQGTPMVYLAGSASLAMLENYVHMNDAAALAQYVLIPVEVPEDLPIGYLEKADLPDSWNSHPATDETRQLGTEWWKAQEQVLLRVPSVVVPVEYNYLLNKEHPDFHRLTIGQPIPLAYDVRLIDRLRNN